MTQLRLTVNALLLFALLGTVAGSCGAPKKDVAEEQQKEETKEKVSVRTVEEQTVERTVEYPCTLNPFEENYLAPSSPGRIEKIYVEIGSRVAKGQVIAQMDRTQLTQAVIQLKTLQLDYDRLDTLAKLGSVAKQQYDQIKGQYDVAKTNVDFLTENTQLTAPFAGVIANKYFEDGELYSGAPGASGKAAIVQLIQIDNLKAFVDIPEQYFPQIVHGMKVEIVADIYPGDKFDGSIFRIHPTVDPASHTFRVEVKIPNAKQLLRPGMYTHVTLELGQEQAIVVPAGAVLKLQGSNDRYIFTVDNGRAKRIVVRLGKRFDANVEIISDEVKIGDRIIVKGQSRLFDQMPVEIVSDSENL
jgi:RND family efflux transporter MFP subunit